MTEKRFSQLLDKLIKSSEAATITWEEGLNENAYQVNFPNYSVEISKVPTNYAPKMNIYFIRIYDESARLLDEFSDETIEEVYQQKHILSAYEVMQNLHKKARRTVLGSDKALDSVIKILDELDEIPF